ncbi:Gfo/Idh/MocA family oxidoreductase [Kineococcus sp. T13]|uniref:Gfo/Idh/MocA family protein n=1 Tax=Kineococcus vitellinus TaxID=2696565 RepID=UPI0014134A88|nr:Gfo/Idh/MocA family oxidoreductase [Kineococcus vitellinus]NAZ75002.1 Gfo/Idh/MocA family oxidoreductase [Kineococcus vitellinus]
MSASSPPRSTGVAVIGAGMAGRAHLAGYRNAPTLTGGAYGEDLPAVRLVAVADAHAPFAEAAASRYGYERAETSWQAIAEADDVDAVSVAVANHLHREVVEGLLAAGKHVLCEKPLAPSVADAEAMVAAAAAHPDLVAAVGFTFRRSPAINAVREQVTGGHLGAVRHFNGHYWCDYAANPQAPMSWRYEGGRGSGALADIGSHLVDLGEFFCGPVESVHGTVMSTVTTRRPLPVGAVVGHAMAEVGEEFGDVGNEDLATFTATFASGAIGTFSVSRTAHGLPNGLGFEVFCKNGAAAFDLNRTGEFTIADSTAPAVVNGHRQVLVGPAHPYVAGGLPMDFPSVGHGQNDFFTFQCRAFLNEVAGGAGTPIGALPVVPPMSHGLHNLRVLDAITRAADGKGETVPVD